MTQTDRAIWRTSSHSGNGGNCVEVAIAPAGDTIFVRDSKDRDRTSLAFSAAAWSAFTASICDPGTRL
jgi:hypothetical protein